MSQCLFQQFARRPRLGAVKTRLQPALSAEQACAVHCELMLATARALLATRRGAVELWLDDVAPHPAIDACLAAGVARVQRQRGADLGARMLGALRDGLRQAPRVVLVGSDCPGLDPGYLAAAIDAIDTADVVLGPAEDGGFVLVGCRRTAARMFTGVRWGRETVLDECRKRLTDAGLSTALLPPRYDIDRPEDLRRWRAPGISR